MSTRAFSNGLAALIALSACGGKAAPNPAHASQAASVPSAAWGLPAAEADLASRRVRGSRIAHVDELQNAPKSAFQKVAGPFAGQAAERDLPTSTAFAVEGGTCYRFYVNAEPSIHALAVVVEDANGGTVVDDASDVIPARGAFCADANAQLRVTFSVGLGQGHHSLELWAKK